MQEPHPNVHLDEHFDEIQRTARILAILRKGFFESDPDDLDAWQEIMWDVLRGRITGLNRVLSGLASDFADLKYKPVPTGDNVVRLEVNNG